MVCVCVLSLIHTRGQHKRIPTLFSVVVYPTNVCVTTRYIYIIIIIMPVKLEEVVITCSAGLMRRTFYANYVLSVHKLIKYTFVGI